jgi:6-pyruvoyltetrahydropterin/6-carboxytetrahydropterin synthase
MKIHTERIISSSHRLLNDKFTKKQNQKEYGKCYESTHGHNWKIEVDIWGNIQGTGMVLNFHKIKNIIDYLDHKHLNDLPEFKEIIPTAENMVEYLINKIITDSEVDGVRVRVYESPESYAEDFTGEIF